MGSIARIAAFVVTSIVSTDAHAGDLPEGFVYLAAIAPEIRQDMRYADSRNFTGGEVPGYRAAECVISREAASALKTVQKALLSQGFDLLVLDCYRPKKAVRHFVAWAARSNGFDPDYHPRVRRNDLIAEGYIARRSGHSTGYAVDLTLTDRTGRELDMGTPFDFFDPMAQTENGTVPATAGRRRHILVSAMAEGGFVNYRREWWHFSLKTQSPKQEVYDFDIVPRKQ
jgi:zinc D-Ala-D-Ala dipeptidase